MQVTAQQMAALRIAAKKAVESEARASFDLSRMVWETRNARVRGFPDIRPWQHWGFESWEEYLKVELQMSVGTAVNHLRIWEVFGIALKGKWSLSKTLPYSKMAVLSMMALNVPDVNALLDNCRTKTVAGIRAMVRVGRVLRNPIDLGTFSVTGMRSQLEEVYEHFSTIRLALGPLSRMEIVLAALRFFVKNEPAIRGLKPRVPKTNQPPSQAEADPKATTKKRTKKVRSTARARKDKK